MRLSQEPYAIMGFPGGSVVKNLPSNSGDAGSIPGSGRSPGEGNGYRLQYSCLENPMDRESCWAVVHFDRAITPVVEAFCVPAHLAPPGSPQAKQPHHLHAQLSLGQSRHRQEKSCVYAHRVASVVSNSLRPCRLWPARLLCQGRGIFRQEY